MTMQEIQAYCVKCKQKRTMANPQAEYTKTGTPGTRGSCEVCGTGMFKMGYTEAHEGLPKPDIQPPQRKATANKKKKGRGKTAKSPRKRQKLVIVESPAKARTIGKFLGKGYTVKASVGHVRDLLRSQLSVDVEQDFAPKYRVPNEKRVLVKELKKDVETAAEIYLATDADREGEAIAWHLMEATEMDPERTRRVVFHEITQDAIAEAFASPREIDPNRVDAQQARRILDRLVGYKISPLLWRRVRNRTSAGRVQSVALRLICERENEIDAFVPDEYWSIDLSLMKQDETLSEAERRFEARLHSKHGEAIKLANEVETQQVVNALQSAEISVDSVKRGERRRRPAAPFITSTLQQEASRRLGFGTAKTMRLAQQLYEGIELGQGEILGLITYMRTDSTNVAKQAQEEARGLIEQRYGAEFLPEEAPVYKTRSRGAQEAHEAIRPSSVLRLPGSVKDFLTRDQYRVYNLIWARFVASQMNPAVYETLRVDLQAGDYGLRSSGSKIKFPGFLSVYEETLDEDTTTDNDLGIIIPDLDENEVVDLVSIHPDQHFTQPPPRYSEASLVKALEEYGIGRPSTYAPIISTIQSRGYVEKDDKRLYPTEVGLIVNDLLLEYFPSVVSLEFTANLEQALDNIAMGEKNWVPVLQEFYDPFEQALQEAEVKMPKMDIQDARIGEACPECGGDLVVKYGRFGKFIGCANFPDCRYTRPFMEKINVACPNCGGDLVERKTKKGRTFYGCANYPDCEWTSWKRPLAQPCPNCEGLLVAQTKKLARCTVCESQYDLETVSDTPGEKETAGVTKEVPQTA